MIWLMNSLGTSEIAPRSLREILRENDGLVSEPLRGFREKKYIWKKVTISSSATCAHIRAALGQGVYLISNVPNHTQ